MELGPILHFLTPSVFLFLRWLVIIFLFLFFVHTFVFWPELKLRLFGRVGTAGSSKNESGEQKTLMLGGGGLMDSTIGELKSVLVGTCFLVKLRMISLWPMFRAISHHSDTCGRSWNCQGDRILFVDCCAKSVFGGWCSLMNVWVLMCFQLNLLIKPPSYSSINSWEQTW